MASDPSTKEKLLRAGEHLFARHGIHQVAVREINALAGQRNRSALHYHFGSREGLVDAILVAHQAAMDDVVAARLDELEARGGTPSVREVVEASVRPLAAQLGSESGRDFLRILPQVLHLVGDHVRSGAPLGGSPVPGRTFGLLDRLLADLPDAVRGERLVGYALVLTTLVADRAQAVESGAALALDDEQFVHHVLDLLTASLEAPSTVVVRPGPARGRPARSSR